MRRLLSSVGAAQIQADAVRSSEVQDGSLRAKDFTKADSDERYVAGSARVQSFGHVDVASGGAAATLVEPPGVGRFSIGRDGPGHQQRHRRRPASRHRRAAAHESINARAGFLRTTCALVRRRAR